MKKILLTLFFACFLFSNNATSSTIKPIDVAIIGGLKSTDPNILLTDEKMKFGIDVFFDLNPEAKKKLNFIYFDNEGSTEMTAIQVKKIVDQGIKFVVGLSKSNQAMVVSKLSETNDFLFITPFATNDKVTFNKPKIFRACFSDSYQGKILAKFAINDLKTKNILVATNIDSVFSIGLSKSFKESIGKQVPIEEFLYDKDSIDLKSLKSIVLKSKPDTVFIPDYVTQSTQIIKSIISYNKNMNFLGGDGWGIIDFFTESLGDYANINLYYSTHWSHKIESTKNASFLKSLKKTHPNIEASPMIALTYDAIEILWNGLKASGFSNKPDAVLEAIQKNKFDTTVGELTYSNKGNNSPNKKVVINKMIKGKHEFFKLY